jgi:hypothetical protein
VQALLVVAHTRLHQPGDTFLHLHHLIDHQVPVSQPSAPISYLRGGHVALGQKVAAQAASSIDLKRTLSRNSLVGSQIQQQKGTYANFSPAPKTWKTPDSLAYTGLEKSDKRPAS